MQSDPVELTMVLLLVECLFGILGKGNAGSKSNLISGYRDTNQNTLPLDSSFGLLIVADLHVERELLNVLSATTKLNIVVDLYLKPSAELVDNVLLGVDMRLNLLLVALF